MTKVFIKTFGCQMNVYDSERMAGVLASDEFEITDDEKSAEYVIINTCSVRQHAEDRALSYIGAAIKDKKVIVAGCMAERMQDELMTKFPRLHAVVGTFNFSNITAAINRGKKKIFAGITEEKYPIKLRRNEKIRGYITIMQGCDNFCAYCIVPYVRGRERSREVEGILAEIRQLATDGFKEVMFLGQNVNSFLDVKSGLNFSGLLKKAAEISGIERLRFMTSHPKDLTDELIESIAATPKVCKHIHLPLQSGSDRILKIMNRHYTSEWYLSRVKKIREAMPGGAITTDILVGFPGETVEDFQQTLDVMSKANFDSSYIFKYSPRRGTKAALMEDQVNEKDKLTRLNNVLELQKKMSEAITKTYVGKVVEIMVTGPNTVIKTMMEGITDNSKKVIIAGDKSMIGKFYKVKVISAQTAIMEGEIIK
ncbi:MAG: tRNA (N6-isopentenyl adenosine(37)-C2)-methylthiotransferase MiaB [bacterium]